MKFRDLTVLFFVFVQNVIFFPNNALAQTKTSCTLKEVGAAYVRSIVRVGSVVYRNNLFEYAIAKTTRGDVPVIFRQQHKPCWLVFADPGGDASSLSEGVPPPVANAFAIMFLKKAIAKDGIQAVQSRIKDKNEMAEEDVYAAKKLGLSVSPKTRIRPYSTAPRTETRIP